MEIDRKNLKLSHPINRLGDYELQIRFSPKVQATLTVSVVGEDAESYDAPLDTYSGESAFSEEDFDA